ncbi:PREDICTED: uncharacterized protein LOC109243393 [Nicotiana attenuata]|uniref:uncharacterized protein LOC109243393 n=1 Tax=Nicotiana attenuata TaxID=49451 RepID=UPI0009050C77|nr:PREDICTED: uncharacterized protein LOC109243393 [Nicotiana attenuata]
MANNQNIRPTGALPGDTEKNPQVNTMTLRNGRELVEVPNKKKEPSGLEEERVPKPVEIHLNIPLVDMLRDVPRYAKYIKDIVANKRRLSEFKTVALTEECTSRIQHKLPQKLKDPGSFTIPVRISKIDVGRALYDLGASINLMPLSVFKQLGLGAPRPTTIGKFIFPAGFIILDYEANELVPIILGRPFLATGDAIIKVQEEPSAFNKDALEKALMLFNHLELEEEVEEMLQILDASSKYIRERSQFEPLDRPIGPPPKPPVEEAPKLELKPLPSHLHYAYLGSSNTLPVIVSSHLSNLQEEKLLRVLRNHKHAIGWTMSDIKGIALRSACIKYSWGRDTSLAWNINAA